MKLVTRPYLLILLTSLLMYTGHYMLMGTLPVYVLELGGEKTAAGLVVTVFTAAALFGRPVFGHLADRRSRRFVMLLGAGILLAAALLYHAAQSVVCLLALRLLNGAGFSAQTTAAGAAVADVTPRSRLAEGIGYYGIPNTVGMAIGPALGLFLVGRAGYTWLFFGVLVFWVLLAAASWQVRYEKSEPAQALDPAAAPVQKGRADQSTAFVQKGRADQSTAPAHKGRTRNSAGRFLEPSAYPTAAAMFFVSLTFGAVIAFLPAYGLERGIRGIGAFFAVYSLTVIVSRLIVGRIADRRGFAPVFFMSLAALLASQLLLAWATSLPVVLAAGVLYGFGYGTAFPLSSAIVVHLCPAERKGAATGTLLAAMDLGIGLGAFVWGAVWGAAGFTWVFVLSGACAVPAAAIYALSHRRKI